MKKIIYFLILLLTFKDVLYSKTEFECADLIVTRKGKWYLGREYYYNNEYVDTKQLRDIFKQLNNDEVYRAFDISYSWQRASVEVYSLFFGVAFWASVFISIEEPHSIAAKVSWSVTGVLFSLMAISPFIQMHYKKKAIDTYNKIIIENRNIIDNESSKSMKHKNVDIFSIGFSHKCDF